jgi:ribose transport system substrate-binding protein
MKKALLALLTAGALAVTALSGAAFAGETEAEVALPENIGEYHLGICVLSLDNEYWAQEAAAAQLAAEAYGVESEVLTCNADPNVQLQGMKDFIAQYGDKACFVVDPATTANTASIAELCEESGNYVTILAHRAEGLFPKDYPHFVVSLMLDDLANGAKTAGALMDAIGGEGQVVEITGLLGDDSATNRHAAFEAAKEDYPDVEVVDSQTASWDQAQAMALTETWLVQYPDLKGIFTSGDAMALGAIEAMANAGVSLPIVGCDGTKAALEAIQAGTMTATILNDAYNIAGYGAAYAIQAACGMLDPTTIPDDERLIFAGTQLVTSENVDEIYEGWIEKGNPGYDYFDLSFCVDHYQDPSK